MLVSVKEESFKAKFWFKISVNKILISILSSNLEVEGNFIKEDFICSGII